MSVTKNQLHTCPDAAPLSYRQLGNRYVVTNEAGDHVILEPEELTRLLQGDVPPGSARDELERKGFLSDPRGLAHTVQRLRRQRAFLESGPNLHIIVVTLRCDHKCVYCHASRSGMDESDVDMTEKTAERVVDMAMSTTSSAVTIEFQGGEPLAHFQRVRQITDLARDEARRRGKTLDISLVTSLSLMDQEKAEYLLDRRVQICTSLDGPKGLHDTLRLRRDGSGYEFVVQWIQKLNMMYRECGLDPDLYHVDALATIARPSLLQARDIIDEYIRLGLKTIHLRPLNPLGLALRRSSRLGYTPSQYLDFYRKSLAYLVKKNLEGIEIQEKLTSVFLKKIMEEEDPGYLDIRSPCGGAIGQLAYDYDGNVYTCDEGRMLARMGDPLFQVGNVHSSSYGDVISSSAARVVCLSSCLEGSPACLACAYRPFCGTCPVLNYSQHGTPFGVIPDTERCQIHKGILDEIFQLLAQREEKVRKVLERWTLNRPRPEFVHVPSPHGA